MKPNIKYSVLMSVYYKENPEWFDLAINSMLKQTIPPDEFVIVEDGPLTDELYKVIDKHVKKNKKLFNIVKLEKNLGLGLALNQGVLNCHNEWIARMDSDDYSVPNRIEKELNYVKENNVDIVGSSIAEFNGNIDNIISYRILPESNDEIIKFSKKRNPFGHPSVMLRKEMILKAGNYRDYHLVEDYDLWIRMIKSGAKSHNFKECLVYMRIGEDFYKRRGGIKYLKSILKFKNEQLKNGYFSLFDYLKSTIPHIIVCLLPNNLRDFIYTKLLRKNKNK